MNTTLTARPARSVDVGTRVSAINWASAATHLDGYGWAMLKTLLTADECESIASLYGDDRRFRSHVVMARHGFGRGEYKYFAYPLPDIVAELRTALYPRLVPIANRWNESMGIDVRFPDGHRGVHRAVPQGRTDAADAAPAAVRRGGLQLRCTRTCTASTSFRCRWRSCSRSRSRSSTAASSC